MESREIGTLSPTLFASLESCRLKVAFGQQARGARGRRSVAAVLGELAHDVLETAMQPPPVTEHAALMQIWDLKVEAILASLTTKHEPLAALAPERWPNYELVRARVSRVFDRLLTLVASCGDSPTVLTECDLGSADGVLRGRADVIIRGSRLSAIVDFKTGAIRDQRGAVRREYLRQLLLYAYLEHEVTGSWPSKVYLIPLEGAEAELSVDPQHSMQVALEAREMLAAYNSAVPGPQPANPSEVECRYCPYATRCEAFWASNDAWTDLKSIRGRITRVARGQVPAVTIELEDFNALAHGDSVLIRSIGIYEHPAVDQAAVGLSASAVGLTEEANRGTFRIANWGRIEIVSQPELA